MDQSNQMPKAEADWNGSTGSPRQLKKTGEEWRKILTPEQYHVLREKGTEPPFTGKYYDSKKEGVYRCAACGNELFSSETKFESTQPGLRGWPAFTDPVNLEHVELREDNSLGMHRTEVVCRNCGSHLGHLFDDEAAPKGNKHYCINSVCLELEEEKKLRK